MLLYITIVVIIMYYKRITPTNNIQWCNSIIRGGGVCGGDGDDGY